MKKRSIFAVITAAALAVTLSACGVIGTATSKIPTLENAHASVASGVDGDEETEVYAKPDSDGYEDNLGDLWNYMKDGGTVAIDEESVTIQSDGTLTIAEGTTSFIQMSYKEIGATAGYRCTFTYGGSTVQVELYSFDPDNLNEKGRECINSAKEKGCFTVLGNEVSAVVHPSEKYMMVYNDSYAEKNEDNADQKAWAVELFNSFKS